MQIAHYVSWNSFLYLKDVRRNKNTLMLGVTSERQQLREIKVAWVGKNETKQITFNI